jgi:hypothetical protein
MPEFPNVVWGIIVAGAGLLMGVLGFFLKGLVSKPEKHEDAINTIKQTCATKDEVRAHEADINLMKQTLATKVEVKEIRAELMESVQRTESKFQSDLKQLSGNVSEIKDKVLYKDDFYRTIIDMNRSIEKLQDYLVEKLGGGGNSGQ